MRPPYLTAFEHQILAVGEAASPAGITESEAEQLAYLGEMRPGFCERGYQTVRLAQYCGIVTLGSRALEILPKVDDASPPAESRGLLLRMLRETNDIALFRSSPVEQYLRHTELLDVFIAIFLEAVAVIVRGGLLRQYSEREEDLRVVRGRILSDRQFTVHSNRPDHIACRFDDPSHNQIWNQVLKAGLRAVRPWIRSFDLNRRWIEIMSTFDEVADVQIEATTLDRLVFDRQAARYRTSIQWTRWILATLSPSLRAGSNTSPSLLFDMNILFQAAVAAALQRRARGAPKLDVIIQDTARHLATVIGSGGRTAFGLRPDLVLRRGEVVIAVGDTKWKRVEVSATGYLMPSSADLYQLHAYAAAFRCEHLALIYPWHNGLARSRETAFELQPMGPLRPVVRVICVDLHSEPFRMVRGGGMPGFEALLNTTAVS